MALFRAEFVVDGWFWFLVVDSRFLVGVFITPLPVVCVCFALCSCYKIVFTCADPESFDRGGSKFDNVFFS